MSNADVVISHIQDLCKQDGQTCRVIRTADNQFTVYDMHHWDDKMTTKISEKHSIKYIKIVHSVASASGFILLVETMTRREFSLCQDLLFVVTNLILMYCILYVVAYVTGFRV
jgi:hypothetical protein